MATNWASSRPNQANGAVEYAAGLDRAVANGPLPWYAAAAARGTHGVAAGHTHGSGDRGSDGACPLEVAVGAPIARLQRERESDAN